MLCEQGHARFRLNSQPMELRAGELLIGTGEQVIDSCEWTSDFKGRFMLISARYTQDSVVGLQRFLPYLIFLLERPVIQLAAEESERIVHTFSLIQQRLSERDNPFQRDVVACCCACTIMTVPLSAPPLLAAGSAAHPQHGHF